MKDTNNLHIDYDVIYDIFVDIIYSILEEGKTNENSTANEQGSNEEENNSLPTLQHRSSGSSTSEE